MSWGPAVRVAFDLVTIAAAVLTLYAAYNDFVRPPWLLANMERLGVAEASLRTLGVLKIAGGVGLLAGFVVPALGIAAAAGLVLFFVGAIVTALRVRWYAHLPMPMLWLALAAASLALRWATS